LPDAILARALPAKSRTESLHQVFGREGLFEPWHTLKVFRKAIRASRADEDDRHVPDAQSACQLEAGTIAQPHVKQRQVGSVLNKPSLSPRTSRERARDRVPVIGQSIFQGDTDRPRRGSRR
jgi:hypothetical protein